MVLCRPFRLQCVVLVSLLQQIFTPTQNAPDLSCSLIVLLFYRCCFFSVLPQMRMMLLFLAELLCERIVPSFWPLF